MKIVRSSGAEVNLSPVKISCRFQAEDVKKMCSVMKEYLFSAIMTIMDKTLPK